MRDGWGRRILLAFLLISAPTTLILAGASANQPTKPGFASGLGTVPTEIEQAAISAATGEVCASGALSTVVNESSTTPSSWQQLEPNGAALAQGASYAVVAGDTPSSPVPLLDGPTSPVYAVFVTGSCTDERGQVMVGARVLLNDAGAVLQVIAWNQQDPMVATPPFGPAFDSVVGL